jgi:hypothetical protein
MALIVTLLIILGASVVLALSLLTPLIELNLAWLLAFVGSSWLSATAITDTAMPREKRRGISVNMEATLISFGLALISGSLILSGFFFATGALCLLFWSGIVINEMVSNTKIGGK